LPFLLDGFLPAAVGGCLRLDAIVVRAS
jgi:hypothetical protein